MNDIQRLMLQGDRIRHFRLTIVMFCLAMLWTISCANYVDGDLDDPVPAQTKTISVSNGDFSSGMDGWYLWTSKNSMITCDVEGGVMRVRITRASTYGWNGSILHYHTLFETGKSYRISFDAWASDFKTITAVILSGTGSASSTGGNDDIIPWENYAEEPFMLSTARNRYSFDFTMTLGPEISTSLSFDLGYSAGEVYFDDITVEIIP